MTELPLPASISFSRAARNHQQLDVVIVASGYGDTLDDPNLRNDPHIRFMSKPYDIDALTTALRALHVRTKQMN